jgi:cytochrome c
MKLKEKIYMAIGIVWIVALCSNFFISADAAEDGLALYKRACVGCHGADGASTAMGIPEALKGQSAADLYRKLAGYRDGSYGFARKNVMENVVKSYSDDQLNALVDAILKL